MTTHPKVLVCGAGSIGRRHIANLQSLGADVVAWRWRAELADELASELSVPVETDLDAAIARVNAVVIGTEPSQHLLIAARAAEAGKALFIEKPLSHTGDGVREVFETVAASNLVVEIGCQLRAHPALRYLADRLKDGADGPVFTFRAAIGQRLDQWRPGTDYRDSYSAFAARGGGALFDLIHEIDLVHWMLGPIREIGAVLATVSDLGIDADDLAVVTLRTASRAVGQVELDMVSPAYRREFEVVCRNAVYRWRHDMGTVTRATSEGEEEIYRTPDSLDRNALFLDHMTHFLRRLDDASLPALCSLDDGIAVLEAALAARRSAEAGGLMIEPEGLVA